MSREPENVLQAREVRRLAKRIDSECLHGKHAHWLRLDEVAFILAGLRLLSEGLDGNGILITTRRSENGRFGPTKSLL